MNANGRYGSPPELHQPLILEITVYLGTTLLRPTHSLTQFTTEVSIFPYLPKNDSVVGAFIQVMCLWLISSK